MSEAMDREDAPAVLSPGRARLIDSYCRWAGERALTAYALLPDSSRGSLAPILDEMEHVSPIWYTDDGVSPPPVIRRRGQVWMVNGKHLPIVDWRAARSAARRHDTEVLIFGSSNSAERRYLESVLVRESGEVVKFKRHYCDSPGFTDLWNGEASLLVASGERVPAVLTHVLTRGWGLESVGALTRRFSIEWSSTPCVLSEFEMASPFGDLAEFGELRQDPRDLCEVNAHPAAPPSARESRRNGDRVTGLQDRECQESGSPGVDVLTIPDPCPLDWKTALGDLERNRTEGVKADTEGGRGVTEVGDVAALDYRLSDDSDSRSARGVDVSEHPGHDRLYRSSKRAIDLVASALGLVVLSPFLVLVAFMVKLTSPGPVLFAHRRQGLRGTEFRCFKFRSMRKDAIALQAKLRSHNEVDGPQFKIGNDPRVTRIGPWLRRYNIDELPQLFNVLLGHMSLVGPRPSPDEENQLCPAWRRTRLSVRPGITGLWQVLRLRGRDTSDFQEWIYYDVEYARHRSLWLDLQLLLYTPYAMFAPRRLRGFAERLERHGICTRAAALRRHYEGRASR